ncbi:PadR family transcriptional regulator [Methyloceanibacter sp.]|uniref:PadR family transcriptional regulator n=1 Tax=Methyloceanibacter sp. TaxID=1965321 RepID=UPI002D71DD8D|nr:PadR family transcriptional regulator [Methyloceanibacter sp.]HZP08249.1 PadR family transcriptional regulator [Methyloceanibacter sp.]
MHGMRHHGEGCRERWAARRFGRFGGGRGPGWGPGPEGGGSDWFRVGRMLAQGDLKLLALALIAERPRHGYELIKLVEEKTGGWYSPSPGVVYPTLTFLEEAGYVTAEAEGAKKRYTITDEGRTHLDDNRDIADMVIARLEAIGRKLARRRRAFEEREREEETALPKLVMAALENVRDVAAKRLATEEDADARIVEILIRAAGDIRGS